MVEQKIQQAMREDLFDNLCGQGKPLGLRENPYQEAGQGLAFSLLKQNDAAPEWIERDKEIRRAIETAQAKLRLVYQQVGEDTPAWSTALAEFQEALRAINRKIDSFNLIVPLLSAHRPCLVWEREVARVVESATKP